MTPRKRKATGNVDSQATKIAKPSTNFRITRNMTTDGPRQAVFKTAELLENILLQLSPKNIFGVQRVSRQFRDLVATSAAIQQKLFLRSSGGERRTWVLRSSQAVGAFNWIVPCDAEFIVCTDLAGVEEKEWTPARLNPLLRNTDYGIYPKSALRVWAGDGEVVHPVLEFRPREPGSWRKMLLTDPTTFSANVFLNVYTGRNSNQTSNYGAKRFDVKIKKGKGLTLGAIIDAAVTIRGDGWARQGTSYENLQDATLGDIMQKIGETDRKPAKCHIHWTTFRLNRMVIPTEEEWESVK